MEPDKSLRPSRPGGLDQRNRPFGASLPQVIAHKCVSYCTSVRYRSQLWERFSRINLHSYFENFRRNLCIDGPSRFEDRQAIVNEGVRRTRIDDQKSGRAPLAHMLHHLVGLRSSAAASKLWISRPCGSWRALSRIRCISSGVESVGLMTLALLPEANRIPKARIERII
jgi:hypothetical protein